MSKQVSNIFKALEQKQITKLGNKQVLRMRTTSDDSTDEEEQMKDQRNYQSKKFHAVESKTRKKMKARKAKKKKSKKASKSKNSHSTKFTSSDESISIGNAGKLKREKIQKKKKKMRKMMDSDRNIVNVSYTESSAVVDDGIERKNSNDSGLTFNTRFNSAATNATFATMREYSNISNNEFIEVSNSVPTRYRLESRRDVLQEQTEYSDEDTS